MVKYLVFLDSARAQLSYTNKKWISVDVRIRPVFPDLVINMEVVQKVTCPKSEFCVWRVSSILYGDYQRLHIEDGRSRDHLDIRVVGRMG